MEDDDTPSEPSVLQYSGSDDFQPSDEFSSDDSRHSGNPENSAGDGDGEGHDEMIPVAVQEEPPKRTRKRQRRESKRQIRKKQRNSGSSYKTEKGKTVLAKLFRNTPCLCKKKCDNNIDEEARKHAFSVFWKLGSFKLQNAYLCGLVKQEIPKCRRPRDGSRPNKSSSNHFYIHNVDGNNINVCRQYLVDTFQISHGRLTRSLKKLKDGKAPGLDERGCHVPANKIAVDRMNVVREHIIFSFPAYQSHYTRTQNPNRKYLPSHLTITAMYKSYLEYCNGKGDPVSEAVYRRTFNSEFNLHFHSPLKDTCGKCDVFKTKLNVLQNEQEKQHLKAMHELHLRKAEAARSAKDEDAKQSKDDPNYYAFTFDLEKALPFPRLTTGIAYYKRNMYLYNLGCHELKNGLGFMYTWDETQASRGSQEISSCVTKHLLSRAKDCKHIVMYSDTCTGQNRNWNFALAMQKLTQMETSIDVIDLKYMVSGHSFLPNDTDFASIESYAQKKLQVIYSPNEWNEAILKCRSKNPFHLTKMDREDFYSTTELVDAVTKRSVNVDKGNFNWLKTQWIRFIREDPFVLFYKETLQKDVQFESVSLAWSKQKTKKNRNNDQIPVGLIEQSHLYNAPRPVTKEKKRDMLDLLDYIPPVHHEFYRNLITGDDVEDIGLLEEVAEPEQDENID
uniref:Uncharacterized protein LOC114345931 n=1 Tax=Diabrotica virgifera virgifera TaxID=50390 RepID=A0A6P7GRT0_DIAVI